MPPSLLPPKAQHILNTRFFRLLMPRLYHVLPLCDQTHACRLVADTSTDARQAFPEHNMTLDVSAHSCPTVSVAGGAVTLSGQLVLAFKVVNGTQLVDAFDLTDKGFTTRVHLSTYDVPPALSAKIDDVHLSFAAGHSAYGHLGPALIALLSGPLNAAVQLAVLPRLNAKLQRVPIPNVAVNISGYRLVVDWARPEIDLSGGSYALVATDANISLSIPPAHR